MSSLKKSLMKQGMKFMSDPRVMKLMQDERVMKAVMQMMSVPGMVQTFTQEQVERLAKSMALATEDEVKDLKRTVRRLEEELGKMKNETRRANGEKTDKEERPSTRSVAAARKKTSAD
jgi:cell division FtsZ-interacting protein ZapD